jgi:hypothetical protein
MQPDTLRSLVPGQAGETTQGPAAPHAAVPPENEDHTGCWAPGRPGGLATAAAKPVCTRREFRSPAGW